MRRLVTIYVRVAFASSAAMRSGSRKVTRGGWRSPGGVDWAKHPDAAGLQRTIASLFACAGVSDLPRKDFMYVSDDGQVVAMRCDDWKLL
jgi:hypothetical protein